MEYEADLVACTRTAKPRGERNHALCEESAFDRYQQCRGILMVNHPPYTVVLTYTDEPRQLTMQAVDSVLVAPLIEGKMAVPFFLDDEEFRFDDELARRLGVAMLNVIAAGRPEVRQHLNLTQHPIEGRS